MRTFTHRKSFVLLLLVALISTQALSYIGTGDCCDANIISVSGDAKVSVQPDIAIVSIGAQITEKTTQLATSQVAQKIEQINQILAQNGINKKDLSTQRLSIYPQYDYTNGRSEVVGQTASQTLEVTVRNINGDGENLAALIDALVAVDGIQLNNLSFDKEDKSQAQTQARKLAFENAKQKAQQYANIADRGLGRVVTIVDGAVNQAAPIAFGNAAPMAFADAKVSTSVAVGDLEVAYSVSVKFSLR